MSQNDFKMLTTRTVFCQIKLPIQQTSCLFQITFTSVSNAIRSTYRQIVITANWTNAFWSSILVYARSILMALCLPANIYEETRHIGNNLDQRILQDWTDIPVSKLELNKDHSILVWYSSKRLLSVSNLIPSEPERNSSFWNFTALRILHGIEWSQC